MRGIRIIPEFDNPSHFLQFGGKAEESPYCLTDILTLAYCPCPGAGCNAPNKFRSNPDPTNPAFWQFMDNLYREMTAIFPDPYFNLGGDEFWGSPW
jgi:hexosaminidase